jgi:hypothetical protein
MSGSGSKQNKIHAPRSRTRQKVLLVERELASLRVNNKIPDLAISWHDLTRCGVCVP